jgi:PhzF family phenazine biosynthesis protein
MRLYPFRLVNVFTDAFSGGNPLAVFPDGRGLSEPEMQALARQMNLSGTAFLWPASDADARLRVFTPAGELPFTGHSILGSAFVLTALKGLYGRLQLSTKAGIIPVTVEGSHFTLTARQPQQRGASLSRAETAAMLRLSEDDIAGEPVWLNNGSEQLQIQLASREAVLAARPELERFYLYCSLDSTRQKAYLWHQANGLATVRLFSGDNSGIREHPGAGSACANLGGWCLLNGVPLPLHWRVEQGHKLQRMNRLSLHVSEQGQIQVGGEVVHVGQGELCLS